MLFNLDKFYQFTCRGKKKEIARRLCPSTGGLESYLHSKKSIPHHLWGLFKSFVE